MKLLERAHKYFQSADIGDIKDINYLKGELSIEYAKVSKEAIDKEHKYNYCRASVYRQLLERGETTTKSSDSAKAHAEIGHGDYIVYKQQAKSIANTIDQLRDIVIGIQYVDKHLSDIK